MNIFKKIKAYREAPERKRITISFGHSIRIKEQGECRKNDKNDVLYSVAGGAGTLGTEVNAEGNSVANGLRVSSDNSIYAQDPSLSVNTFMATDKVIDLDKGEEYEKKNIEGAECPVCDTQDDIHYSKDILCDNECTNINIACSKKATQGAPRGRVFSQKHTISFLLCDALVCGGVALGLKLLKGMMS